MNLETSPLNFTSREPKKPTTPIDGAVTRVQMPEPKYNMSVVAIDKNPTRKPTVGPPKSPENNVRKATGFIFGSGASSILDVIVVAVRIDVRATFFVLSTILDGLSNHTNKGYHTNQLTQHVNVARRVQGVWLPYILQPPS